MKPSEYILKESEEIKSKMINVPKNDEEIVLTELITQVQAIKNYLDEEYERSKVPK